LCFLLNLFIQIFNPYSYSPLASFLNSKMFWEMFPLYFLGFYSLRSLKAWQSVFMVFLVMASLNGAVAVYQSSIGPEVISNWGPGYYSQIYGVASRTFRAADGTLAFRPMGLGSDAGFSGALGIITLPMLITLFLKRRQSSFWQDFYLYVLLAGVAIAIYASASRTTLILSLVFGIFSTLFLIRETSQWRLFGTLIAATLLIGVILQQLPTIAPYLGGRYDSIGSLDETVTTFTAEGRDSQISSIPLELSSRFFLGAGLDNLGPGAGAVSRITHTRLRPQLQNSENNINLTILGLGVPGLIVWLLLHLQFIRLSWEASSLVQDRQLQTYLAGAFALMVLFLIFWPFSNLISFPQNLLFWLLPGMAAGTLDEARKTAANAS
jgi:hypothetical protein